MDCRSRSLPWLPRTLVVALAGCFAPGLASAQLAGLHPLHGNATTAQQGTAITVTTVNGAGTSHSVLNWDSFGIPGGTSVYFQQPNPASTSINRVVQPNPSAIDGALGSNGRVVLVNPAGIAIGAGARIDTAGFTASTLGMSPEDAIAGRMRFVNDGNAGPLTVAGSIVAHGGDVFLIAPTVQVEKNAVVEAQGGAAVLAAGQAVEITGRGLEGIHFDVQAPEDSAVNLGTLKGDAVGIFAGTLRHSGLIQAQTATQEGGRVVLLAREITVDAGGVVDASGATHGGTVLVGGAGAGASLRGDLANAQDVLLARGSVVHADATSAGDGGHVVVWGDETAGIHGEITARGGAQSGNGGFVETSARVLDVTGRISVSAARGRGGRWLLDPEDVDVGDEEDDNIEQSGNNRHPKDPHSSKIKSSAIEAALDEGGTVVIDTEDHGPHGNGSIRINKPITKNSSRESTLELHANRDIRIGGAIMSSGEGAGNLNLVLDADSDRNGSGTSVIAADVDTAGGRISAPGGAPAIAFGDGTGPGSLTIRARLGDGTFDLNTTLCDSDLVAESATVNWWGGTSLLKTRLAILPAATLNIVNHAESTAQHRLSQSELWNFGQVLVDDGAGDLVVDDGSLVRNALTDDSTPADFGLASTFAQGAWYFRGNATVRGNGGTFRNQGVLLKGSGALDDVEIGHAIDDATTTTLDATHVDVFLDPSSLLLVASGTFRLAGTLASDTSFVNQGTLFINTGATFSAQGHSFMNASEALIAGGGTIVADTLRNQGSLIPGLFDADTGTLTVAGNYVQESTGHLLFTIRSSSDYARLHLAGGSATLAGDVTLVAAGDGSFAAGDVFDVVTNATSAAGTVTAVPPTQFEASTVAQGVRVRALTGSGTPAPTPAPSPSPPPTSAPTPAPTSAPTPAPTSGPTPAPSPAPSPSPAPVSQSDRIVEALDGQATPAQARQSVTVTQGSVASALDDAPTQDDGATSKKRDHSKAVDDGSTCR